MWPKISLGDDTKSSSSMSELEEPGFLQYICRVIAARCIQESTNTGDTATALSMQVQLTHVDRSIAI